MPLPRTLAPSAPGVSHTVGEVKQESDGVDTSTHSNSIAKSIKVRRPLPMPLPRTLAPSAPSVSHTLGEVKQESDGVDTSTHSKSIAKSTKVHLDRALNACFLRDARCA